MGKAICGFMAAVVIVAVLAVPSRAQEQEKTMEQQEKDALITNIVALRNQEARVAVLQQLFSEQTMSLRQMQAVFCDQYKLDPDKFRQGLYSYDEQQSRFIEKSALEEAPAKTAVQAKPAKR